MPKVRVQINYQIYSSNKMLLTSRVADVAKFVVSYSNDNIALQRI